MTKIKFGTDGWRAIIADTYTNANVARVAEATALWIKSLADTPKVIIGYDCRFGGKMFSEITAKIMCAHNIEVIMDKNFVSTPMISLATVHYKAQAGIVITASHNPPSYNGFKIKAAYGGPAVPSMISTVETLIPESADIPTTSIDELQEKGKVNYANLEDLYVKHIQDNFDLDTIYSSGIKLGFDAMYGAGQNVMRRLFPNAALLHCEYNPSFNGQAPEPIHKNLGEFAALIKNDEDIKIGIANDGDADRIGLYDENGNFVDSHHIILLLVHYLHQYKGLTGKIITTFSATGKIKDLAKYYGLDCQITKIGFKYICQIMVDEATPILVGGEESGGIAAIGHIPERDGVWIGLLILEFMAKTGKSLTELINDVYALVGSFKCERNDLHITNELKLAIMEKCKQGVFKHFGKYQVQSTENVDGYKFHFSDSEWVMMRPSGTEPVLRVYAQAPSTEAVNDILQNTLATILPNG